MATGIITNNLGRFVDSVRSSSGDPRDYDQVGYSINQNGLKRLSGDEGPNGWKHAGDDYSGLYVSDLVVNHKESAANNAKAMVDDLVVVLPDLALRNAASFASRWGSSAYDNINATFGGGALGAVAGSVAAFFSFCAGLVSGLVVGGALDVVEAVEAPINFVTDGVQAIYQATRGSEDVWSQADKLSAAYKEMHPAPHQPTPPAPKHA